MTDRNGVSHETQRTLDGLREIVERTGDPKLADALEKIERAVRERGYGLDLASYEDADGPKVSLSVIVPGFPLYPGASGASLEEAFREFAKDPDGVLNPWLPPFPPPGPGGA